MIIIKTEEDLHTNFMACEQRINWNVNEMAHYENANGFIVQEVVWQSVIDNNCTTFHYYEAWEVISGICEPSFYKTPDDCDDAFCIGERFKGGHHDWELPIIQSIGHCGRDE